MRKLLLAFSLLLLLGIDVIPSGSAAAAPVTGADIVATALRYVGYPYTTVGNSPSTGFSCIGFVSYVYGANGIPLPDDLWDAMAYAPAVAFSDLQPGDVLFFQNTVWAGLSHTAIYLGGGRFVHAEWYNRGVVTSSFTNDPIDGNYWTEHYLGASRPWGVVPASAAAPVSSAPASSNPAPASPSTPQLADGPRAQVEVAGLNVRVRPSLLAPIRRLASEGTKVVVLQQYRSWDWVQLPNGSFGWVAGTAIGTGATSSGQASAPPSLTTSAMGGLRVHVRPDVVAPVVASTYRGQKVLVVKRWLGWLRVELSNGSRGWVDGALLMKRALRPGRRYAGWVRQAVPHHAARRWARARWAAPHITATVRVHVRPGLHAPILRLAAAGTHVRILQTWRMWTQVRFPSGRAGWVYRSYVKVRAGSG